MASDFLKAFSEEWSNTRNSMGDQSLIPYADKKRWTTFMLGINGFFHRVMKRLHALEPTLCYITPGWYYIDAVYVGGVERIMPQWDSPSTLYALIEHELDESIEEEMWKLVHWRAPLKIIVFYDWAQEQKTTDNRRKFLRAKLLFLKDILDKIEAFHSENVDTEYLFLIGTFPDTTGVPEWQWASIQSLEPRPLAIPT